MSEFLALLDAFPLLPRLLFQEGYLEEIHMIRLWLALNHKLHEKVEFAMRGHHLTMKELYTTMVCMNASGVSIIFLPTNDPLRERISELRSRHFFPDHCCDHKICPVHCSWQHLLMPETFDCDCKQWNQLTPAFSMFREEDVAPELGSFRAGIWRKRRVTRPPVIEYGEARSVSDRELVQQAALKRQRIKWDGY